MLPVLPVSMPVSVLGFKLMSDSTKMNEANRKGDSAKPNPIGDASIRVRFRSRRVLV